MSNAVSSFSGLTRMSYDRKIVECNSSGSLDLDGLDFVGAEDASDTPVTSPTKSKPLRPEVFYRDSAYRASPAQKRLYGGSTVTVYMVRLGGPDEVPFRIEAFGKLPADRKVCATLLAEKLMIERAGQADSARASEIVQLIMKRGHARRM